jgi:hypothetical protein
MKHLKTFSFYIREDVNTNENISQFGSRIAQQFSLILVNNMTDESLKKKFLETNGKYTDKNNQSKNGILSFQPNGNQYANIVILSNDKEKNKSVFQQFEKSWKGTHYSELPPWKTSDGTLGYLSSFTIQMK